MRRIPFWGVLGTLVLVSTAVRAWAGLRVPTPWIAADEIVYAELGRSLWETGRLEILGADTSFYSAVHPALVGLPLALFDTALGYDLARVLQALAMSLTAVPVFLWGRRLMSEPWALVAAALTLTLPAFAYSGLLMTESVFLPATTLAAWSFANALERPTPRTQALAVLAFGLALLTRLQALVLVPAFLLALVLLALLERSTAPLRRSAYAAAGVVLLGVAWLAGGGFGAYEPAGRASYSLADALRFGLYHVGDLLLLVGLAPACALVLLAFASNSLLLAHRAFLAVTISLSAGLVAQVGLFASRYVGRLAERDLLAAAPLLLLALCLWLDRGAPRTRLRASLVAIALAAFVLFLPYGRLVHKGAIQDAFMLLPLWELGSYDAVAGAGAGIVVLLVVLLPRALPLVLALVFAAVSVEASRFVEREARALEASFFGTASPAWVDAAATGEVAYFYDGEPHWNAVWSHVFWNRRIARVYSLAGTERVPGPLPQVRVAPDAAGILERRPISFVLASTAFTFFGNPIASIEQQGLVQRGLTLWDVEAFPRLSTVLTGVQGSGDIYGPARLVAYDCTGGHFQLTLVAKGAPVTVGYRAAKVGTIELAPEQVVDTAIPSVPVDGVCTLALTPSGLVGSTRFEFVR